MIRRERDEDRSGIRLAHGLAFGRAAEANLVDALRAAGGVTLSLVAEWTGEVAGHILFSPVTVVGAHGAFPAVGLGPLAVVPGHQRRGVGAALVRAGLSELQSIGHEVVVVLGHPTYYPRFGFVKASTLGLRWQHEAPDEAFMALELTRGALAGRAGVVRYRAEFDGV